MIPTIIQNLERGIKLLNSIDDAQYCDKSVAPYHSSIGVHMRHILDVFDCITDGLHSGKIDLTARKRNVVAENKVASGLYYFETTIQNLQALETVNLDRIVQVSDDLGNGVVTANYTLASVLIQAHSHAIHHFASIGYIINQLNIQLPDEDFGYNPTTPRNTNMSA